MKNFKSNKEYKDNNNDDNNDDNNDYDNNDYDDDDDNNKIKNNKLNYFKLDEKYEPPKTYGLNNSNQIIPNYYQKYDQKLKIMDISYYEIIKDDIRNFRYLNDYQLDYIKNLSDKHKNELIELFNNSLKAIVDS